MTTTPSRIGIRMPFSTLWALAALIHMEFAWLWWTAGTPLISATLCSLCALAVLARPNSIIAFSLLLFTQLIDVFIVLPECPNHWFLMGTANLVLLAGILGHLFRFRALPSVEHLTQVARGPMQIGVVIFYWWTAVWKLNSDFFDPSNSCAVHFTSGIFDAWMPSLAAPIGAVSPPLTLFIETVLPLALLFPKWRYYAILALVAFHAGLGLYIDQRLLNFSSVMFALLWLFTEAEQPSNTASTPVAIALGAAWSALVIGALLLVPYRDEVWLYGRFALWMVYTLMFVRQTIFTRASFIRPSATPAPRGATLFWLFPVLTLLNGTAPILGLKTGTSWQMYSNIQLSHQSTNHFLLPPSLDLMGWISDSIHIEHVSNEDLNTYFQRGNPWPTVFVRTLLHRVPDATISYRKGDQLQQEGPWNEDPLFERPNPYWISKIARFGPIEAKGRKQCSW